jgi:hypothetical protein
MPGAGISAAVGYERAKRDSKTIKFLSDNELSDRVKEYTIKKKYIDSYGKKIILSTLGLVGLAGTVYASGKLFNYNSDYAASFALLIGMPILMIASNTKLSERSYVRKMLEFAEDECKKRGLEQKVQ